MGVMDGITWSLFQSTLPVRGERLNTEGRLNAVLAFQSTLPCAGSDLRYQVSLSNSNIRFNPRSPVRGATANCNEEHLQDNMFQSTLLCGERLHFTVPAVCSERFQSTLPCWERLPIIEVSNSIKVFQSAPCAGSDVGQKWRIPAKPSFNPRSPVRGATDRYMHNCIVCDVSIHAPLCGERLIDGHDVDTERVFQSTLPCAGSDRQ